MADDERELTAELGKLGRIHAGAAGGSPPAGVDAAILARSRDAVRASPRSRRWWIPASVAATALIAVSLVTRIQHESGTGVSEQPVVAAKQPSSEAASAAPASALAQDSSVPPPPDAATAPIENAAPVPAGLEAGKRGMPPRQAVPRIKSRPEAPSAGAQLDTEAAPIGMAIVEESGLDKVAASPSVATAAATVARTAERDATPVTPEAWLERIEALETAGSLEEAARERALLEEAYPGWLAARSAPH